MEQLCATLVPVVNKWRVTLAEELSCIEAGRATAEEKDMYKNHRAFLDCMLAYIQSVSVEDSLAAFLESSENIGLTKHMLFRSRATISDRLQYVCKRCVLIVESVKKPDVCIRCNCSGIARANR